MKPKISIDADEMPLGKVLREIQRTGNYNILFSDEIVTDNMLVSIHARNQEVPDILNMILPKHNLFYTERSNNLIVVSDRQYIDFKATKPVIVTGRIINSQNKAALRQTTVIINSSDSLTRKRILSDENGEFKLSVKGATNLHITITNVSYLLTDIFINGITGNIDLGNIEMEEKTVELDEVKIATPGFINKVDKKVYYVTSAQRSRSSNGVNIIQQLLLPVLQYNPASHEISTTDNRKLQFRINNAEASKEEISALPPEDILKIEFYDLPGVKFGNSNGCALNYIVKHKHSGGYFGTDLNNALNSIFGSNQVFLKLNKNKSEVSANYQFGYKGSNEFYRNNSEVFRVPEGPEVVQTEFGVPNKQRQNIHQAVLGYSYYDFGKNIFNAVFRYRAENFPITSFISNASQTQSNINNGQLRMMDNITSNLRSPSVNLYFEHKLSKKQTLILNITGTQIFTNNKRVYREDDMMNYRQLNIVNSITGTRNSLIAQATIEQEIKNARFSYGVQQTQSSTENNYRALFDQGVTIIHNETNLYGELLSKKQRLNYILNLSAVHYTINQLGHDKINGWYLKPKAKLKYDITPSSSVSFVTGYDCITPALSQISNVRQEMDSFQVVQGNPNLRPYNNYAASLMYDFKRSILFVSVELGYVYDQAPVMDEVAFDGKKFVRTFNNQKYFSNLNASASVGAKFLKDHISLSLTASLNDYKSAGHRYEHDYLNTAYGYQLLAWYKNVALSFTGKNPGFTLYGETLQNYESLHTLSLTYNKKQYRFGISLLQPFSNDYSRKRRNLSYLAPYERKWYWADVPQSVNLTFGYNFRWGREYKTLNKKIINTDNETGVLNNNKNL